MKKRLRKKLNFGEFQETGFEITWKPKEQSEADLDKFLEEFLAAITSKGLAFGGGSAEDKSWEGVVVKNKRYASPDAADKEFVSEWFKNRTDIEEYTVGHDFDLWYGSECTCCSHDAP
jgi:uncharacterized protein YggL (DUF469 family)